jgi:hypothetical protein
MLRVLAVATIKHWESIGPKENMPISAFILQRAIPLYLQVAYADGAVPEAVQQRVEPISALAGESAVPLNLLEANAANSCPSYALRLGQPKYPFMKIVVEPAPRADPAATSTYLLRVDAHDRHLHAPAGSPDAAWLASVRSSNQEIVEKVEAAWSAAGLPTFKDFLRKQLDARKAQKGQPATPRLADGKQNP